VLSAAVFHLRRAFLPVLPSTFVCNFDVVIGPYRAPAANSHLAVAISVSFRKSSKAALPFAVLNSSCKVSIGVSSVLNILFLSFL
jgi:hypothetical protein